MDSELKMTVWIFGMLFAMITIIMVTGFIYEMVAASHGCR